PPLDYIPELSDSPAHLTEDINTCHRYADWSAVTPPKPSGSLTPPATRSREDNDDVFLSPGPHMYVFYV
ncbi:uncharacterized, partial [Tachysurus ichikawai]